MIGTTQSNVSQILRGAIKPRETTLRLLRVMAANLPQNEFGVEKLKIAPASEPSVWPVDLTRRVSKMEPAKAEAVFRILETVVDALENPITQKQKSR